MSRRMTNQERKKFEAEMAEDLKSIAVQKALHMTPEDEARAQAEQAEDWKWEQQRHQILKELPLMDELLTDEGWQRKTPKQSQQ